MTQDGRCPSGRSAGPSDLSRDASQPEAAAANAERLSVHMPSDWSAKKKAAFLSWLNDELSAEESAKLLQLPASVDRSPKGGDQGTLSAIEDESAVGNAETPNTLGPTGDTRP